MPTNLLSSLAALSQGRVRHASKHIRKAPGGAARADDALSILYTECSAGDVETIMSCIATLGEMEYEMGLENLRAVTLGRVSLKSELTESCGA